MASLTPHRRPIRPDGQCLIRTATPDDAAGVLDCARDVFATSPHTLTQADEFTLGVEEERAFIAEKLTAPNEIFLIALETSPEGRVIGILDLRHNAKRRKVRHLVVLGISVRSTHRGRGVGKALLAAAIEWAQANPMLELMTLEVYADNAAGLGLYRQLGFVEYGRLPDGCKHDDGSMWEQVMMVRGLKS